MKTATTSHHLAVARAADIAPATGDRGPAWLVEHLWGSGAVGVVGGAPKLGKTWLALELAVAVASGRPCLGRFSVPEPGPVLLYAAEDAPQQLRERLEQLCRARGAQFETLPLDLILEPSLKIDRPQDVERLRATLALQPYRLLILDPYVRLQGADENNVTEVAAILATLREISRAYSLALLLVHHARKSPGPSGGLALRGSSDFYAWGDSFLYLHRRGQDLVLSVEHRAATTPPCAHPCREPTPPGTPPSRRPSASLPLSRTTHPRRPRPRPAPPRATPRRRGRPKTIRPRDSTDPRNHRPHRTPSRWLATHPSPETGSRSRSL